MRYFSTNDENNIVDFRTAVMQGLAKDGGLYMPVFLPSLEKSFYGYMRNMNFEEISFRIAKEFVGEEIEENILREIIYDTCNFPFPLTKLNENEYILELFHGPTLAFKDLGARFMARVMSQFAKDLNGELNILVATSGDTGSAVAHGFYGLQNINVFLLYPKGKVSEIQEKQLTTLGENITALEIDGTFDDCQKLVKSAFVDSDITDKLNVTSANSINIARLIPQSFYYFEGYKQLDDKTDEVVFSVPSGNLGNLTAGLFASKMGLNIDKFIAGTNINRVFTNYIHNGHYEPIKSVRTISNAMDVGNPSNLERIRALYNDELTNIRKVIFAESFSDQQTVELIKKIYNENGYILDPHGAVGLLALKEYLKNYSQKTGIVLETAHPAKFTDILEDKAGIKPEMPARLKECLNKDKKNIRLSNKYSEFKDYLLN
jgi:threonine synthase